MSNTNPYEEVNSFTLTNDKTGEQCKLPVYQPTDGIPLIDVRKLTPQTGHFTFDPGFASTASCASTVTFIDGDNGILRYRGYDIKDLVQKSDFMEVAYLLLKGELPNSDQKTQFVDAIYKNMSVHEGMRGFFNGFRRVTHPMAIMCGALGSLPSFYVDEESETLAETNLEDFAIRVVAKVVTIGAMVYRYGIGEPFLYPDPKLSYAGNLLYMMFGKPNQEFTPIPAVEAAMDKLFILHADHEQNASTSTVRLSISSGTNPYAAIAAGVATLWGPAHGGANEAVIKMLKEIGDKSNIEKYLEKAKDKNDPFRLMGFGHRVYKNYDPRAAVIRDTAHEMLRELNIETPLMDLALELEHKALNDPYFQEKKLFPNLDYYSGILFQALGLPTRMFTLFFTMARSVGWVTQLIEQAHDPVQRIGRPRQLYYGSSQREFVELNKR